MPYPLPLHMTGQLPPQQLHLLLVQIQRAVGVVDEVGVDVGTADVRIEAGG